MPPCHGGGQGFKSPSGRHFGSVAQSVEQRTENPRVSGSIPLGATILFFDLLAQSVEHLTFNQGVPRSSRGWITIYGALVKWLRHRPFTAASRVRIPYASPILYGRLAQLGERLPYKQDVSSSILLSPTTHLFVFGPVV